jgi:hypothetical protein
MSHNAQPNSTLFEEIVLLDSRLNAFFNNLIFDISPRPSNAKRNLEHAVPIYF